MHLKWKMWHLVTIICVTFMKNILTKFGAQSLKTFWSIAYNINAEPCNKSVMRLTIDGCVRSTFCDLCSLNFEAHKIYINCPLIYVNCVVFGLIRRQRPWHVNFDVLFNSTRHDRFKLQINYRYAIYAPREFHDNITFFSAAPHPLSPI